jgi:hypothetical protein
MQIKDVKNWDNHRPFLFWAIEKTKDSKNPIVEFGCGYGSTPYLQEYAKLNSRKLISYDYDLEWANKYDATYVKDWDSIQHSEYSVALIDHSPAERRHIDIALIKDKCEYIIIHDTDIESTGYMYDKIWHLFPYRLDLKTTTNGHTISATIVSKKEIPKIIFDTKENIENNIVISIDYTVISQ